MKRVIFVEPQMDNGSDIFEFFKKNNSDSRMVGMHICLVFPFDSDLTTDDMQTIIEAYERYSIRIPIKILAQMKSKFQSDRYLFYSQ